MVPKDKIVVSYDLNTVLVSLANKKRFVALTARPVKDDRNEMIGVSVQIREKTLTELKWQKRSDISFPKTHIRNKRQKTLFHIGFLSKKCLREPFDKAFLRRFGCAFIPVSYPDKVRRNPLYCL